MKFLRKISKIDNGRYGVCSLPKPILNDLLALGAENIEFVWDERRQLLTGRPV